MNTEQLKFMIVSLLGLIIFTILFVLLKDAFIALCLTVPFCMMIFTGLHIHVSYKGDIDDK